MFLIFQKALLIVVAVVEQLSGALGESGLLVLPCVAAHINQVPSLDLSFQYHDLPGHFVSLLSLLY